MTKQTTPLAKDHTGMRVSASGMLTQLARRRDTLGCGAEQLLEHLQEVAKRYYAGDVAVVDEFLQAYALADDRPNAYVDPTPAPIARKDHEVREFVNELRDVAMKFHATQQLRERIAGKVRSFLRLGQTP